MKSKLLAIVVLVALLLTGCEAAAVPDDSVVSINGTDYSVSGTVQLSEKTLAVLTVSPDPFAPTTTTVTATPTPTVNPPVVPITTQVVIPIENLPTPYPIDGEIGLPYRKIPFKWELVTGIDLTDSRYCPGVAYELRISKTPDFAVVLIGGIFTDDINYTYIPSLSPSTTYYWKITVVRDEYPSGKRFIVSEVVYSFTTRKES